MTGLTASLLGACAGLGVLVVVRAFRRQRTSLTDLSRMLASTGQSVAAPADGRAPDLGDRAGRWAARFLESFGLGDMDVLRSHLRVLDKSVQQHAFEKLTAAVVGLSLPMVLLAMLVVGGQRPPVLLLLVLSIVLAIAGFLYPDLPLKELVSDRRRAFRHALSAYLELVCVLLAGGAGTQTALAAAAEAGDGWAFVELRRALDLAGATNRSAHELIDELGLELGVTDLRDLASSLALAGGHGARVKESLIAKSDAMRHSLAADLEAMAETRTEKMIIPVVVMTVGLTLFIGFAAVMAITGGSEVIGVDPLGPSIDFTP